MLFSVIVPIYKVEAYLAQCVESVLGQTFGDFEVILVDDGSPDRCPQMCDEYAARDPRVRVVHQANAGLSAARNAGLEVARGEWVMFVDSDDWLTHSAVLEQLAQKISAAPQAEVIFYKRLNYYPLSGATEHIGYTLEPYSPEQSTAQYLEEMMRSGALYLSACNKTIRRKLLVDNNIRFTPGLLGEDTDWFYGVMLHAEHYDAVDEEFYTYRRQRPGSITNSAGAKNIEHSLWIVDRWTAATTEQRNWRERLVAMNVAEIFANLVISWSLMTPQVRRQFRRQVAERLPLLRRGFAKRSQYISRAVGCIGLNATGALLRLAYAYRKFRRSH